MTGVLRPMAASDLAALLPIQREGSVTGLSAIFPQDRYPFPDDEVQSRWEVELADPEVDCFIVTDGGRPAGFAATHGPQLLHFGTAVHTWGTGLAAAAHDEILDHLRDGGHAHLWLRVFADNPRARRFYERRGWRSTGQEQRSTFPPHAILLRYELRLAPHPSVQPRSPGAGSDV